MPQNKNQPNNKKAPSKKSVPKKECIEEDVISRLIFRQLDDILIPLLLLLDIKGLTAARSVCRSWHQYLSSVFWTRPQARRVLESRLVARWQNEHHKRLEMVVGRDRYKADCSQVLDGRHAMNKNNADCSNVLDGSHAMDWCNSNCALNLRRCSCDIWCLVRGSRLMLRLAGKNFKVELRINQKEPTQVLHEFSRPVHLIKLCMKDNLEVDTRNNLDTPCFFKKSPRFTKAKNEKYLFSKNEKDANCVVISDVASGQILKQFIPYTGWGEHHPICHMKCDRHHLALLINGRVFVYSISRLVSKDIKEEKDKTNISRLVDENENKDENKCKEQYSEDNNLDNALVLVGTRKHQPPVNFIYLKDNILLTVGGNTVVMFDFWDEEVSGASEFFS